MWDILLLAEEHDLPGLSDILKRVNPNVAVKGVSSPEEMAAATANPAPGLRLVCFCTGVIVPAAVLQMLPGPSYNFHPGPPDYRGIYPAVFAIYNNATVFGATAHELSDKVDDGAIVAVELADMPENIDRLNLEAWSRQLVTGLFIRLAPQLIGLGEPLSPIDTRWSGRTWTRKDFEALCQLPDDIAADEFERRYRAVGEGPEHAITLRRFGRSFSLDPVSGDGLVYKGGQAIRPDKP